MSNFGETAVPGTSTAWDENIQGANSKLLWQRDAVVPSKIQSFFIMEGRHIADRIKSFTKLKLQLENVIQDVNLMLYRTEDYAIYVCAIKDYNLQLAGEIVELLKPYITVSNDVYAILTKPIAEYQATENTDQEYVMRSLSTTKAVPISLANNIPQLEEPNFLSGVSAAVINLRKIMNQFGAVIVCYTKQNEEHQINELQELLNKLDFGPVQSQPNSSQ